MIFGGIKEGEGEWGDRIGWGPFRKDFWIVDVGSNIV